MFSHHEKKKKSKTSELRWQDRETTMLIGAAVGTAPFYEFIELRWQADGGDGYTALQMNLMPLNWTL